MFGISALTGTAAEVFCGVLLAAVAALGVKVGIDHFKIASLEVQVANGEAKAAGLGTDLAVAKGNAATFEKQLKDSQQRLDAFNDKCQADSAAAVTGALRSMQATVTKFAAIKPGAGPEGMNSWQTIVLSSLPAGPPPAH